LHTLHLVGGFDYLHRLHVHGSTERGGDRCSARSEIGAAREVSESSREELMIRMLATWYHHCLTQYAKHKMVVIAVAVTGLGSCNFIGDKEFVRLEAQIAA
jgi:hypothetical protein